MQPCTSVAATGIHVESTQQELFSAQSTACHAARVRRERRCITELLNQAFCFFTGGCVVEFDGVISTFPRICSAQRCVAESLASRSSNYTIGHDIQPQLS
ncbi:hypothetical protein TPS_00880 [Trichinella pseudospiralis]